MEWIRTPESSNIVAIKFDVSHILIQFKGGKIYSYSPCNQAEFDLLLQADSKGAWVFRNLRKKKAYKRLAIKA